jgi:hypothetical protein
MHHIPIRVRVISNIVLSPEGERRKKRDPHIMGGGQFIHIVPLDIYLDDNDLW